MKEVEFITSRISQTYTIAKKDPTIKEGSFHGPSLLEALKDTTAKKKHNIEYY